MGMINVLTKEVAELIAAGEVIERPASVIKELVENAIDAGATVITVEIKNGGVTFMRVTDNGVGIERSDVKNAFLRHATSKIAVQNDLDHIATLGFRGEALASICAVSKVDLITKHKDEETGTLYKIEGGSAVEFRETGCPQGTTMVVRDLFYNVPARMKFLKKDISESNNIATLIDRIALSHPEISFCLIRDGRQTLKTSGNGELGATIYQVFGKQFYDSLIPVSYHYQNITVSGFVSKPVSANRASRSMQTFFVNGRYVRTKTGMAALEQAYKGFIMVGKYPACVLNLEMDCSELDVNVHPAKLEIRFTNERPVYESVYHAVRTAVSEYDTRAGENAVSLSGMTDPKLLGRTADRGTQLDFGTNNAKSSADAEPEVLMPPPSGYSREVRLNDSAAARNYYQQEEVRIRPINLAEYRALKEQQTFLAAAEDTAAQQKEEKAVINRDQAVPLSVSKDDKEAVSEDSALNAEERTSAPSALNEEKAFSETLAQNTEGTPSGTVPFGMVNNPPIQTEISDKEPDVLQAFPVLAAREAEPFAETMQAKQPFRYIGEAFMTYLIVQYDDNRLMLIDKHAAHERLIYEKLKRTHKDTGSQLLLEPITITLDRTDFLTVTENKELLSDAGFEIEEFGTTAVLLRSIPLFLEKLDVTEAFLEIAKYLTRHKRLLLSEKMEWIYANTACRAAIKAGDKNSPQELEALVQQLEDNPTVRYCPHGRPIYYFVSRTELEKNFRRI